MIKIMKPVQIQVEIILPRSGSLFDAEAQVKQGIQMGASVFGSETSLPLRCPPALFEIAWVATGDTLSIPSTALERGRTWS